MSTSESSPNIDGQSSAAVSSGATLKRNMLPCDSCARLKRRCKMISPGKRCSYCKEHNFQCIVSKKERNTAGMDHAQEYDPNKPKPKRASRHKKPVQGAQGAQDSHIASADSLTNKQKGLSQEAEEFLNFLLQNPEVNIVYIDSLERAQLAREIVAHIDIDYGDFGELQTESTQEVDSSSFGPLPDPNNFLRDSPVFCHRPSCIMKPLDTS
ncbi:hypothetical protein SCHPADRAFT_660921 [Schizopora paradoxa]|uniref:Zn(2)-C6 fungal-type domain-containing protein n=1 Tax=Schizopora paradoxa TaxID=27342 RepID=A0A0H2RCD6_9AGAM|nr:hypothetical protein SCHPADRAFT_660921 [Schizopora paradoxa]